MIKIIQMETVLTSYELQTIALLGLEERFSFVP